MSGLPALRCLTTARTSLVSLRFSPPSTSLRKLTVKGQSHAKAHPCERSKSSRRLLRINRALILAINASSSPASIAERRSKLREQRKSREPEDEEQRLQDQNGDVVVTVVQLERGDKDVGEVQEGEDRGEDVHAEAAPATETVNAEGTEGQSEEGKERLDYADYAEPCWDVWDVGV